MSHGLQGFKRFSAIRLSCGLSNSYE